MASSGTSINPLLFDMSDAVIRAHLVGKRYEFPSGKAQSSPVFRYRRLSEELWSTIRDVAQAPFRRREKKSVGDEEFWALRDVSLEVKRGEIVGLIGKNGAGKSTLLKLLSRITKPTCGWAEITGTVGSLLEVGTGFHPELTGRENIYLNGAILGMTRSEVRLKFDEIVAFAEVERFLDMPVKHYSSGMYVRLAFAVAAHLETDILFVDEVLAVGDMAFQKKCLGRMEEIAGSQHRTIFFVSHQLATITSLCTRALWIDGGRIRAEGPPAEVVGQYLNSMQTGGGSSRDLRTWKSRRGNGEVTITSVELQAFCGPEPLPVPRMGDSLRIRFRVENRQRIPGSDIRLSVAIKTFSGQKLVHVANEDDGLVCPDLAQFDVEVNLPDLKIYPGLYTLTLWAGTPRYTDYDHVEDCLDFEVAHPVHTPRAFKIDSSQGLFLHASTWRESAA